MHIEKLFGKIAYVVSPQRRNMQAGLNICQGGANGGKVKSNIKSVKAVVNGTPKKIYVCTQCLKSGKVERA